MNNPESACAAAREAIYARNFSNWHGLPSGCAAEELFSFEPDSMEDRATRSLGSDFDAATFVLLEVPGYYRPMANFKEDEFVMFDGMPTEPYIDVTELRAAYGEPAAHLDWYFGTLEMREGELPYPERGITLFVNSDGDRLLHVALFHPTSLDAYMHGLRPHLRKDVHPIEV